MNPTLPKILLLLALCSALLVGLAAPVVLDKLNNGSAPEAAQEFAQSLGAEVLSVADRDTDGDGYVSVVLEREGLVLGAQCGTGRGAYWLFGPAGCKLDTGKRHGYPAGQSR